MQRMFRLTLPKTEKKPSSTSIHTLQIKEFGKLADADARFPINCTAVRWIPVLFRVPPQSTHDTVAWDHLLDEKDRTDYEDSADEDAEARIHYRRNRYDPQEAFEALLELRYLDAHCNSGKSQLRVAFKEDIERLMPAGTANGKEDSVYDRFRNIRLYHRKPAQHRVMPSAIATKHRNWKPQDDSILRGLTIDASSSRLSNRQANLPELFALLTTQPPNADQGYMRRCDVAKYATQTPDLGAFQTIGFSEVSHRRIGVRKIGAPPLLSTNYERSEREKCNASLYDVFIGEDQVIVVEKQQWKIPTESDTVVRNASGVLPEIGWPRDLLVPTGTGMIGPEIYDLVIENGFSRQARKIPQGVLAAVTLRSRSEIFLEVRIFRGSYQHSDGEEYDCLDRSRPCSEDTDRTYLDADDDGTLRTASWSSSLHAIQSPGITYSMRTTEQITNIARMKIQKPEYTIGGIGIRVDHSQVD
ncbi:hypothetical protein MRX96_040451 [Rhipicephalus microplus]